MMFKFNFETIGCSVLAFADLNKINSNKLRQELAE